MKIFVATREGQGLRSNDFCYAEEGELVRFSFVCDADGNDPDGGCGCCRSMSGCKTGNGTTTLKVIELNITKEEYLEKLMAADVAAGFRSEDEVNEEIESYRSEASDLLEAANIFPVGLVLERRGNDIQPRSELRWTRPV